MNEMQFVNALNAIAGNLGRISMNQSAQIPSLVNELASIAKYLKEIENQLIQIAKKMK
jgi:hypothetical protein